MEVEEIALRLLDFVGGATCLDHPRMVLNVTAVAEEPVGSLEKVEPSDSGGKDAPIAN